MEDVAAWGRLLLSFYFLAISRGRIKPWQQPSSERTVVEAPLATGTSFSRYGIHPCGQRSMTI